MKSARLHNLAQLRLLVGFLGERGQFAWWPTSFYEAPSRAFLEPVFAKTSRLAQYSGVLEAARRLHDEHLNVGCYHLFRLPEIVEQDLHSLIRSQEGEEIALQIPHAKAEALEVLKSLGGNSQKVGEGPIAIGRIDELESADISKAFAGTYWSAFSQGTKSYPYLKG